MAQHRLYHKSDIYRSKSSNIKFYEKRDMMALMVLKKLTKETSDVEIPSAPQVAESETK